MKRFLCISLSLFILISSVVVFSTLNVSASASQYSTPSLNAPALTKTGLRVSWRSVSGNPYYRVFYRKAGHWKTITTVKGTCFLDRTIADGERRVYTVRCVTPDGNFCSDYNHLGVAATYYSAPTPSVLMKNNNYVISWAKTSSAKYYRVYRKQFGSSWIIVSKKTKSLSFKDSLRGYDRNGIYTYVIRTLDSNGRLLSSYDKNSIWYKNGKKLSSAVKINGLTYNFRYGRLNSCFENKKSNQAFFVNGLLTKNTWYKQHKYSVILSQSEWLYELLMAKNGFVISARNDAVSILNEAKNNGVIKSVPESYNKVPVTRKFVAETMVRALGYNIHKVSPVDKEASNNSYLQTLAYFGYFLPDKNDSLHGDNRVTKFEFDALLSDLKLYRKLKGKTVIGFGDSIMRGQGNKGNGVAKVIGEKYGMHYISYAISRATIVKRSGVSHIRDQVQSAINKRQPADLILFNGGTNDMRYTELGDSSSINKVVSNPQTFTENFVKIVSLLRDNWTNVPIIYVRAHEMNYDKITSAGSAQQIFGQRAVSIAQTWNVGVVDVYSDSKFNTKNAYLCNKYTQFRPDMNNIHDSVHPTALGYAIYYYPLLTRRIASAFP